MSDFINKYSKKLILIAIAIQIAGICIALGLYGIVIAPDSKGYIEPAVNFLAHGIMQSNEGVPILFRTPGYPMMLSVIYLLTGGNNLAVVVIQAFMSLGTGFFVYKTVNTITAKQHLGILALYLWTACIMNYYYVCCILTEIPFIFFFTLSIMLFFCFTANRRTIYSILSFVFLAISLLIKPAAIYLCFLFALALVIAGIFRKISWKTVLLYLCIMSLAYGGWSYRNYHYYGVPMYSSVRYSSYYLWYAPLTYQVKEGVTWEEACDHFSLILYTEYPDYNDMGELDRTYAMADIGRSYVSENTGAYLILNLKGLGLEMIGPGKATIDKAGLPKPVNLILYMMSSGIALLVYVIYAAAFLSHIKKLSLPDIMIFIINGYMMAGHAVLGYSRYRMSFFATCIIGAMISLRWSSLPGSKDS